MKNMDIKVTGTTMTIVVDLTKEFGRSNSGKTIIIASSEGNVAITDNVKLGLNVYKKPE